MLALAGAALVRAEGDSDSSADGAIEDVFLQPVFGLTNFMRSAQILHERAGFPVSVDVLRPSDRALPPSAALVMPPPCKVLVTRPESQTPTTLRLAVGIDSSEFVAGRGSVRFVADLDGERVLDEVRHTWPQAAPGQRAWISIDVPEGRGRQLVLTTQPVGEGDAPTRVGFVCIEELESRPVSRVPAGPKAPNVVFLCIGGLRPDRLGCHGYSRPTSPVIDALAARGTRFDQAFAASSSSLISTGSLMTGLPAPQHSDLVAEGGFLGRELTTLAETFRTAGVATAGFSANPVVTVARGFAQGFDSFEEAAGASAGALFSNAARWIEEHDDQRFFLYLQPNDLIAPFDSDPESIERLGLAPLGDFPAQVTDLTAEDRRIVSDRYDAAVATLDRSLGRLMETLDELGLTESTIVCVTSDRGQELGDHGWVGDGRLLSDDSVRVPFILAGPGVPAGDVLTERCENRFVAETVRGAAGIGRTGRGADLLQPYARIQKARAPLFFAVPDGLWIEGGLATTVSELYAVDVDGYRLYWSPDEAGEDRVRLHELDVDPQMRVDVSGGTPQRVYAFQRMIASWLDLGYEVRPAGLGSRVDGSALPRGPARNPAGLTGHEPGSDGE